MVGLKMLELFISLFTAEHKSATRDGATRDGAKYGLEMVLSMA